MHKQAGVAIKKQSNISLIHHLLTWGLLLGVMVAPSFGQNVADLSKIQGMSTPVSVEAVGMATTVKPGHAFAVAVIFEIQTPWHINGSKEQIPKELNYLIPTQIKLGDDANWLDMGKLQKPEAHHLEVTYTGSPIVLPVYEKRAVFYLPLSVKQEVKPGDYNINLSVKYQTCDDKSCLAPKTVKLSVPLKVGAEMAFADAEVLEPFNGFDTTVLENFQSDDASGDIQNNVVFDVFGLSFAINSTGVTGLLGLLVMASIGGMLLNLTPCVLPVIPLKIMLLHKSAGSRSKGLLLGIFMSIGVLGFWLALGVAIASLSGFSQVNQLFQYPLFTLGMGIVISVLAIGMCGLFTVSLPTKIYNITPRHDTLSGSILFGVMTAVLSTPCTGPFMGAAAAWSASQPALITILVFGAIGVGMAVPYLILSAFPKFAEKLPSAGPVSVLVKQFLGLCLLAAGAYFLGIGLNGIFTTAPDEPGLWHWWLVCGILAAAGLWLVIRSLKLGGKRPAAITWAILGLLMVVGSLWMGRSLTRQGPIDWVMYTPDRMIEAQKNGQAVMVDFTAQWCLNCQVLEHQVLYAPEIATLLGTKKIIPMKVDLTSSNPQGNALLEKAGRLTIPLLVIYDAKGGVLFKSDAYTIAQVRSVLEGL